MDKEMLLKDVIYPLKRTAKLVDKKIEEFQTSLNKPDSNGDTDTFPVESWTRMQDMKSYVTSLKETCSSEETMLRKNTELLSQYNAVTSKCLDLLGGQVSVLQQKLSKNGYTPTTIEKKNNCEDKSTPHLMVLTDYSNIPKPETQIPLIKPKSEAVEEVIKLKDHSPDNEPSELQSPKMPVLPSKKSEILNTPTAPNIEPGLKKGIHSSTYFNQLSSPTVEVNMPTSHDTPDQKSTSRAFFPVLNTPKTPELNFVAMAPAPHEVKVGKPIYSLKADYNNGYSDDEQLVMHSRRSPLANFDKDSQDVTLTQLKMKHPMPAQEMASPATPDLQQYGVAAMKTNSYLSRFPNSADSPDALQSPVEPNLVQDRLPKRRSFWVSNDEYEVLPIEMRRLFTIEQANGALYAMKMELAACSQKGMTLEDIEKATSLGGKTQSFVLMLTTLGAIRKVPGTNRYHISE